MNQSGWGGPHWRGLGYLGYICIYLMKNPVSWTRMMQRKEKKKKIYSLSRSQSVSQPVDFRRVPAGPIFSSGSVRFVFRVDQKNASRQGDRFVRLSFSWGISIVTVYSYQDTPILYASFTRNQYTYVALPSVIRQNSKSPPVSPSPYFYLKMLLLSPPSTYGDRQH